MNLLKNLTKSLEIKTEAEIQFELAYKLKRIGFDIRLERSVVLEETFRTTRTGRNSQIRIDILVLKNDKLICAIEVKDFKGEIRSINKDGRQFKKYLSLGIPFLYCYSENHINSSVKKVLRVYIKSKK